MSKKGFQKGNTLGFKEGESGNPSGGTPKRVHRSKLRRTVDKLRELEPTALANIKASVEGNVVDKDVLQSSKWTVEKIASFTMIAIQEEEKNNSMKIKNQELVEEAEVEQEDETPKPARFSLTIPSTVQ